MLQIYDSRIQKSSFAVFSSVVCGEPPSCIFAKGGTLSWLPYAPAYFPDMIWSWTSSRLCTTPGWTQFCNVLLHLQGVRLQAVQDVLQGDAPGPLPLRSRALVQRRQEGQACHSPPVLGGVTGRLGHILLFLHCHIRVGVRWAAGTIGHRLKWLLNIYLYL